MDRNNSEYQRVLDAVKSPDSGWEDSSEAPGQILAYAPSLHVALEIFFNGSGFPSRYTVTLTDYDQSLSVPIVRAAGWRVPGPMRCRNLFDAISL